MTAHDVNDASEIKTGTENVIDKDLKTITAKDIGTDYTFKREIVWKNAIGFLILHILALGGLTRILMGKMMWQTLLFTLMSIIAAGEGVTVGAHRLYSHRSFKAHPLLRAALLVLQTVSGQNCLYVWVRDHRLHHRYSDTDGDPHNAKRGFFFCHIGWLMSKRHPLVKRLGKNIDLSDLEADWMVMFQKKYYKTLYVIFAVIIPISMPVYIFGETWINAAFGAIFRYVFQLNVTWLVNSATHRFGPKPYDKSVLPAENGLVSFLALGEGWHNYHHVFPWDYKTAELTTHFNLSASFIRFFEKIGLAYDLKSVPAEEVESRIKRTGDGTHYKLGDDEARSTVTAYRQL